MQPATAAAHLQRTQKYCEIVRPVMETEIEPNYRTNN